MKPWLGSVRLVLGKEWPLIAPTNRTVLWFQGAYGPQIGPPLMFVAEAVLHILEQLNSQSSPPDQTLTTRKRNIIIRARYAAGVSQADFARQFGISYQRVHQIVDAVGEID